MKIQGEVPASPQRLDQQVGYNFYGELRFSRIVIAVKSKTILGKVGESDGDNGRAVF